MKSWLEDLLTHPVEDQSEEQLFAGIQAQAHALGFAFCAFAMRAPLPLSRPRVSMLHNFPGDWKLRRAAEYLLAAREGPAAASASPWVWNAPQFQVEPQVWAAPQAAATACTADCHAWAQVCVDGLGGASALVVAPPRPLAWKAMVGRQAALRCLAQVAQLRLAPAMRGSMRQQAGVRLTAREVEVLRWTADGKSTQDVADILQVSSNTVGFHIKNAMAKLQSCNKTASVVQAALLGYLS